MCCCVSLLFWREIGFGCTYYYVLTVPYSCGVVLVFFVLAGNSFWCYVRTQCTIQLCGCGIFCFVAGKLILYEKKFQSSVWRVRDRYYERKKKFQSSVWRVRDCYYDWKKKFQSSVWRVRDRYYDRKKKSSSRLSVGCAITTISTTGRIYAKSSDFYAKLNVSNLNVSNLYQFQFKLI